MSGYEGVSVCRPVSVDESLHVAERETWKGWPDVSGWMMLEAGRLTTMFRREKGRLTVGGWGILLAFGFGC